MSRFAANLGFLFTEYRFLDRFAAARRAGFEAVEFPWPADPPAAVAERIADAGLRVALMNMEAGDLPAGERGFASDPGRVDEWQAAFDAAMDLAHAVGCPMINVLAGNRLPDHAPEAQRACYRRNLAWALPRAEAAGRTLVLEVLNPVDLPDYLFMAWAPAAAFVESIGHPRFRLGLDTYHVATIGDDPAALVERSTPLIGHVQVADAPGRGAPGTGQVDFPNLFEALAEAAYAGAIGLEYLPARTTEASLAWLPRAALRWTDEPFRM